MGPGSRWSKEKGAGTRGGGLDGEAIGADHGGSCLREMGFGCEIGEKVAGGRLRYRLMLKLTVMVVRTSTGSPSTR